MFVLCPPRVLFSSPPCRPCPGLLVLLVCVVGPLFSPPCPSLVPLSLSPPPRPGMFSCGYECNSDTALRFWYPPWISHGVNYPVFVHVTRESGTIAFKCFHTCLPTCRSQTTGGCGDYIITHITTNSGIQGVGAKNETVWGLCWHHIIQYARLQILSSSVKPGHRGITTTDVVVTHRDWRLSLPEAPFMSSHVEFTLPHYYRSFNTSVGPWFCRTHSLHIFAYCML